MKDTDVSSDGELKEIHLTDYLYVVLKWRKTIFGIVGITFMVTILLVFLILPRWYKSTAVVMPPKQKAQFSVASAIRNLVPFGGLGLQKASDELYNYMAILTSRTCMEEIVRRFDLVKRYNVKNVEGAIKELQDNAEFNLGTEDIVLEITVFDQDSIVAADMANTFVDVLNTIYLKLMTQEAKSNREFLERRYQQNLKELKEAEEALKDFQKQNSVYALPEQVKAAVQAAAEIKSQVMLKEISLGILHRTVTEGDPRLQQTQLELSELRKKMRELKFGGDTLKAKSDIFSPFEQTPELGMQYVRKFRELEIQQKLLEILLPLYEQAKIEEQRDTPTMLVLDKAVPVTKPAKPKRILYTLVITTLAFILSIFLVFTLDYIKRVKYEIRENQDEKLRYLESQLQWKRFFLLEKSQTQSSEDI